MRSVSVMSWKWEYPLSYIGELKINGKVQMNKFMFFFEGLSYEREGKALTRRAHRLEKCINCHDKRHMNIINDLCERIW